MPITTRAQLIIPEILQDAIRGEFQKVVALNGTGAAVVSPTLPGGLRGGDTVKVPYFGVLGELEDVNEGTPLTPQQLTMTSETATVRRSGRAFEITTWAQLAAAYADPYAEAARQLREAVTRRIDQALIDAALTTDLFVDVYSASNPRTIDYDVVVNARMAWGDEQGDIALLVVHSKVFGDLLKLKDSTGRPLVNTDATGAELPRFAGVPVRVSDRLPVSNDTPPKYTSLLVKRAALAAWYNGEPEVQTDRDILADTQIAAVHVYWVAHRYSRLPGGTRTGVVRIVTN